MAITLDNISSPNNTTAINANFTKIQEELNNNTVKRTPAVGEANEMHNHFDMNGERIVNAATGVNPNDVATVGQMADENANISALVVQAEAARDAAQTAEAGATTQVGLATTQVSLAQDEVALAQAEVAAAAAQAGIATTQAGIATTKAAEAAQSASDAQALVDGLGNPVLTIGAGTGIAVDATDPSNPVVSSTVVAGGQVDSVVSGTGISIDNTDPANPVVSSTLSVHDKVDIATFIQGVTADSEKLMTYTVNSGFTFPVGLTGSNFYAEVTATGATTFDIQKNSVSIGSIDFAIGSNTATVTFTTETSFVAGDRLQLVNQATADATLADVSISLQGVL